MKTPELCYKCGEQAGWYYTHIGEIAPFNEDFIDDNGHLFCSQECMDSMNPKLDLKEESNE